MQILKSSFLKAARIVAFISIGGFTTNAYAGAIDYFSGCMTAMGAGLAGTAFANNKLEETNKITTSGYLISGGISCLAGMAYVGVAGSQSTFNTEWRLKTENEKLSYQYQRLSKERCLLKNTCEPGGPAYIVETETEVTKKGDKVYQVTGATIEVNE